MTNDTENPGNRDKNVKKNWLHSLSRRKKSSTSTTSNSALQKLQNNESSSPSTGTAAAETPSTLTSSQESSAEDVANNSTVGKERKRKDDRKNVFQRFTKRVGIRFSMRQKKSSIATSSNRNDQQFEDVCKANDQYVEDVYKANGQQVENVCNPHDLALVPTTNLDPAEMVPFTYHYQKFVAKKWLENPSHPNRVMYNACSEMLTQVWYWGEISRRDAQSQLKDKPIGSFLIRDSETGGSSTCWYTLSFRILNCTLHYRLEHRANYWHFEELQYESIVEMIEDILQRCTKHHFVCFVRVPNELQPPLPVVMKYPVSRYIKIMKLQDLCRRVIQRHVSTDNIQELQIPFKLQEYLCEKRELVF